MVQGTPAQRANQKLLLETYKHCTDAHTTHTQHTPDASSSRGGTNNARFSTGSDILKREITAHAQLNCIVVAIIAGL